MDTLDELQKLYDELLKKYPKGLSSTSTKKFDEINDYFSTKYGIDKTKIYSTAAGTRPTNLEVRLTQGRQAVQNAVLGLAFIRDNKNTNDSRQRLTRSSFTTIEKSIGRGKAKYQNILVLIVSSNDDKIYPSGLIYQEESDLSRRLVSDYNIQISKCVINAEKDSSSSTNDIHKNEDAHNNSSPSVLEKLISLIISNKNLILTGAPGTGKTYLAWLLAKKITGDSDTDKNPHIKFCQFHPSYDYADFVEGLRPTQPHKSAKARNIEFERQDGVFKAFCKNALNDLRSNGTIDNFDETWDKLISLLKKNITIDIKTIRNKDMTIQLNKGQKGIISPKYASEEAKRKGEYSSSDLVGRSFSKEQLLNVYHGKPGYDSGRFDNYRKAILRFMKESLGLKDYSQKKDQQPYVFIIDEINRGDVSKIFGELFFAIDQGYRGCKNRAVVTQYHNLLEDNDVFKEGFYVPENIYIIGTMNDIDRSVESMDIAFRRRFAWKKISPDDTSYMLDSCEFIPGNKEESKKIANKAKNVMKELNEKIANKEFHLGESYKLGAAYFLKLKEFNCNFSDLWEYSIEPLLEEYLRGTSTEKALDVIDKLKETFDAAQNKD